MPREHEGSSPYDNNETDINEIVDIAAANPGAEPEDLATVEQPPEAWSKERIRPTPEHEVNGEKLTDEEIVGALGQKFSDTLSPAVIEKLKNDLSMRAARDVLRSMSSKNLGVVYDGDTPESLELAETLRGVFEKHFGGETESTAPEDLPSTEEAELESRGKTGVRGLTKKALGLGKDVLWMGVSPGRFLSWGTAKYITKNAERQEKWRERHARMTAEELTRSGVRTSLMVAGAAGLFIAYRLYGMDYGSGGGSPTLPNPEDHHGGGNGPHGEPGQGGNSPVDLPTKHGEFTYNPNFDPARDMHKHGNDWGTAVVGTPEDNGKPAGHSQFFDQRIKQSPKEFSATLSEFGLNGKSGTDINNLAEQMKTDPKFAEAKYNELMKMIGSAKVYEITYDGDYGSYYAVSNPDGTVTLSYDEVVAGKRGNRFIVYEINGVKHYGHPDCGMQWSHFNPNAPKPVIVEQQQSYSATRSGTNHYTNHPTPPSNPPRQPPTGPPPPGPPPPGPDKVNHFPFPGDGTYQPAPTPAGPPRAQVHVEQHDSSSGASSHAAPGTEHGSHPSSGVGRSSGSAENSGGSDGAGDQGPPS